MRSRFFLVILVAFTLAEKTVQLWMCLERCDEHIEDDLAMIKSHREYLTDVSFEIFNLEANSSLVFDNFTDVTPTLKSLRLGTHAMVSTCCPWSAKHPLGVGHLLQPGGGLL